MASFHIKATELGSRPIAQTETHYSPKVLIGNWQEERALHEKQYSRPISTYSVDFKNYPGARPDVLIRRHTELNSEGLSRNTLFGHGNQQQNADLITWYDEHYNNRPREGGNKLPPLRNFSSSTMSWVPEKSDYPIQGQPTNFGLHGNLQKQWIEEIKQTMGTRLASETTYKASYTRWPGSIYLTSKQMNASTAPYGRQPAHTVYPVKTTTDVAKVERLGPKYCRYQTSNPADSQAKPDIIPGVQCI